MGWTGVQTITIIASAGCVIAVAAYARRNWTSFLSYSVVAFGAAVWLVGSMIIAFPENATHLELEKMSSQFLKTSWHPLSILALLLVDVWIAIGLLKDFRVRDGLAAGTRLGWVGAAILTFLFMSIALPSWNPDLATVHPVLVALGALAIIGVVRGMSYAPPQRARRVRPVTATLPADETGQ